MREKSAIRLAILALSFLAMSQMAIAVEAPDFRNARWGMTMNQVAESEEIVLIPLSEHPVLAGSVTVASMKSNVYFEFVDSQLSEAFYVFLDTHVNENLYITDFEKLRELLTLKYGPPGEDEMIWRRDLRRDKQDQWGFAVVCGDLIYRAEWDTPRTRIVLSLSGDNFEAFHSLTYESKVTPTTGPDLRGL